MGQKVHPYGLRLGINRSWKSLWYASKNQYAGILHEDLNLRKIVETAPEVKSADVSGVQIIRQPQFISIIIYTASPGVIIGVKGANIEKLSVRLQKVTKEKLQIKIREVKRPEINAQLIAMNVARQLKMRFAFKRTLKMAVANAMRARVQGIKIRIAGRLGGSEMSRVESYKQGRAPLHTLQANIDYGFAEALTTYGVIGVKVWVCVEDTYTKTDNQNGAGKTLARRRDTHPSAQLLSNKNQEKENA